MSKLDDIRGIKTYLMLLSIEAFALNKKKSRILKSWGIDDIEWKELDKILKDESLMLKLFDKQKQKVL